MTWILRLLILLGLGAAAGCSMESAIEKLSSAEDRAFASRFVDDVRTGNEEALKSQFDLELWAKSREQLPHARTLFPPGKGSTKLIGYHIATHVTIGHSSTRKDYVLVTTDQTHWTRTEVVTLAAAGGPARVVQWSVNGFGEPPPDLKMYESMERILPLLQAGALVVLIGGIGLIWWLVRRSRRRAAAGP